MRFREGLFWMFGHSLGKVLETGFGKFLEVYKAAIWAIGRKLRASNECFAIMNSATLHSLTLR